MAPQHKKQKLEISKDEDVFRRNSSIIINHMLELSKQTEEDSTALVDEILHSIFFLRKINFPNFSPHRIENDMKNLDQLRRRFPNAFVCYSSELPHRCPISCLLDMIVQVEGQQNEGQIIKKLQDVINRLHRGRKPNLISFTICISQKDDSPDSIRYYGVSMSTGGCPPGQIMVAASCLGGWDSHVADAVMTYCCLDKSKRSDFDGTFKLPQGVRCQTFSLTTGREMLPCRSCGTLFGLDCEVKKGWACGNCAEVESLSNLLKNESEVKNGILQNSNISTDNRQTAKKRVRRRLESLLSKAQFEGFNVKFYTPQRATDTSLSTTLNWLLPHPMVATVVLLLVLVLVLICF